MNMSVNLNSREEIKRKNMKGGGNKKLAVKRGAKKKFKHV